MNNPGLFLVELFAEHGLGLLFGSTALLGLGALAMSMHQRPIHIQRVGELTLLGVMVWLTLAVVPMPRFDWSFTPFESNRLAGRAAGDLSESAPVSPALRRALSGADGRQAVEQPPQGFNTALWEAVFRSDADAGTDAGTGAGTGAGNGTGNGVRKSATTGRDARLPARVDDAREAVAKPRAAALLPSTRDPGATPASMSWVQGVGAQESNEPMPVEEAALDELGLDAAMHSPAKQGVSPWIQGVAWVLLGGSATAALYLLLGFLRLRRILADATPAPTWVTRLFQQDAGLPSSRKHRLPRVVVSTQRCGPFCFGAIRPTIVLPAPLVAQRSTALRHVLLHELAHARQGDGRGQLLVALALPVLWMHPLYWWIRKRVRFAAELVADDQAAGVVPREHYARELIGLAETGWPTVPSPIAAPTILRSPSEFSRRIEMLLQRSGRLSTQCSKVRRSVQTAASLGLVVLATGFFGAPPAEGKATPAATLASPVQDAGEYERLMAEKDALMAQMQEMRAMMEEMRAQMQDQRDAQKDAEFAEFRSAQSSAKAALEIAAVQRAQAAAATEQAVLAARSNAQSHEAALRFLERGGAQRDDRRVEAEEVRRALEQHVDRQVAEVHAQNKQLSKLREQGVSVRGQLGRLLQDSQAVNDAQVEAYAEARGDHLEWAEVARIAQEAAAAGEIEDAVRLYQELAATEGLYVAGGANTGGSMSWADVAREAQGRAHSGGGSVSVGGGSGGAGQADLLQMMNAAIEMDGELRLAELKLHNLMELADDGAISMIDVEEQQVRLHTLKRKHAMLENMLKAEMHATEMELAEAHEALEQSGGVGRSQLVRLQSRLEMLVEALSGG